MQTTPRGNRLHIAIFGRRNAGKSSLINALAEQEIALVSSVPGTTTDPVYKAMEIPPLGPVVMIDTAGIDDAGELGELRVKRTMQVLNKAELAILVIDATVGVGEYETGLAAMIRARNLPLVVVVNKIDLCPFRKEEEAWRRLFDAPTQPVSALRREGIEELKEKIIENAPRSWLEQPIVGDLLEPGDVVVLVVPIDIEAPRGRLILPQVQTLRDLLDHGCTGVVTKEDGLKRVLASLSRPPRLVVTDSQAFGRVAADTPRDIPLTSFSILYARYKGDLATLVAGARRVAELRPGDRVLIAEACTHHRVEDDIGREKIPRWLRGMVGGDLDFTWAMGTRYPDDLETYRLIVHCGGCMITRTEMMYRLCEARRRGVPVVNYGVLIAHVHGILDRALAPFPAFGAQSGRARA